MLTQLVWSVLSHFLTPYLHDFKPAQQLRISWWKGTITFHEVEFRTSEIQKFLPSSIRLRSVKVNEIHIVVPYTTILYNSVSISIRGVTIVTDTDETIVSDDDAEDQDESSFVEDDIPEASVVHTQMTPMGAAVGEDESTLVSSDPGYLHQIGMSLLGKLAVSVENVTLVHTEVAVDGADDRPLAPASYRVTLRVSNASFGVIDSTPVEYEQLNSETLKSEQCEKCNQFEEPQTPSASPHNNDESLYQADVGGFVDVPLPPKSAPPLNWRQLSVGGVGVSIENLSLDSVVQSDVVSPIDCVVMFASEQQQALSAALNVVSWRYCVVRVTCAATDLSEVKVKLRDFDVKVVEHLSLVFDDRRSRRKKKPAQRVVHETTTTTIDECDTPTGDTDVHSPTVRKRREFLHEELEQLGLGSTDKNVSNLTGGFVDLRILRQIREGGDSDSDSDTRSSRSGVSMSDSPFAATTTPLFSQTYDEASPSPKPWQQISVSVDDPATAMPPKLTTCVIPPLCMKWWCGVPSFRIEVVEQILSHDTDNEFTNDNGSFTVYDRCLVSLMTSRMDIEGVYSTMNPTHKIVPVVSSCVHTRCEQLCLTEANADESELVVCRSMSFDVLSTFRRDMANTTQMTLSYTVHVHVECIRVNYDIGVFRRLLCWSSLVALPLNASSRVPHEHHHHHQSRQHKVDVLVCAYVGEGHVTIHNGGVPRSTSLVVDIGGCRFTSVDKRSPTQTSNNLLRDCAYYLTVLRVGVQVVAGVSESPFRLVEPFDFDAMIRDPHSLAKGVPKVEVMCQIVTAFVRGRELSVVLDIVTNMAKLPVLGETIDCPLACWCDHRVYAYPFDKSWHTATTVAACVGDTGNAESTSKQVQTKVAIAVNVMYVNIMDVAEASTAVAACTIEHMRMWSRSLRKGQNELTMSVSRVDVNEVVHSDDSLSELTSLNLHIPLLRPLIVLELPSPPSPPTSSSSPSQSPTLPRHMKSSSIANVFRSSFFSPTSAQPFVDAKPSRNHHNNHMFFETPRSSVRRAMAFNDSALSDDVLTLTYAVELPERHAGLPTPHLRFELSLQHWDITWRPCAFDRIGTSMAMPGIVGVPDTMAAHLKSLSSAQLKWIYMLRQFQHQHQVRRFASADHHHVRYGGKCSIEKKKEDAWDVDQRVTLTALNYYLQATVSNVNIAASNGRFTVDVESASAAHDPLSIQNAIEVSVASFFVRSQQMQGFYFGNALFDIVVPGIIVSYLSSKQVELMPVVSSDVNVHPVCVVQSLTARYTARMNPHWVRHRFNNVRDAASANQKMHTNALKIACGHIEAYVSMQLIRELLLTVENSATSKGPKRDVVEVSSASKNMSFCMDRCVIYALHDYGAFVLDDQQMDDPLVVPPNASYSFVWSSRVEHFGLSDSWSVDQVKEAVATMLPKSCVFARFTCIDLSAEYFHIYGSQLSEISCSGANLSYVPSVRLHYRSPKRHCAKDDEGFLKRVITSLRDKLSLYQTQDDDGDNKNNNAESERNGEVSVVERLVHGRCVWPRFMSHECTRESLLYTNRQRLFVDTHRVAEIGIEIPVHLTVERCRASVCEHESGKIRYMVEIDHVHCGLAMHILEPSVLCSSFIDDCGRCQRFIDDTVPHFEKSTTHQHSSPPIQSSLTVSIPCTCVCVVTPIVVDLARSRRKHRSVGADDEEHTVMTALRSWFPLESEVLSSSRTTIEEYCARFPFEEVLGQVRNTRVVSGNGEDSLTVSVSDWQISGIRQNGKVEAWARSCACGEQRTTRVMSVMLEKRLCMSDESWLVLSVDEHHTNIAMKSIDMWLDNDVISCIHAWSTFAGERVSMLPFMVHKSSATTNDDTVAQHTRRMHCSVAGVRACLMVDGVHAFVHVKGLNSQVDGNGILVNCVGGIVGCVGEFESGAGVELAIRVAPCTWEQRGVSCFTCDDGISLAWNESNVHIRWLDSWLSCTEDVSKMRLSLPASVWYHRGCAGTHVTLGLRIRGIRFETRSAGVLYTSNLHVTSVDGVLHWFALPSYACIHTTPLLMGSSVCMSVHNNHSFAVDFDVPWMVEVCVEQVVTIQTRFYDSLEKTRASVTSVATAFVPVEYLPKKMCTTTTTAPTIEMAGAKPVSWHLNNWQCTFCLVKSWTRDVVWRVNVSTSATRPMNTVRALHVHANIAISYRQWNGDCPEERVCVRVGPMSAHLSWDEVGNLDFSHVILGDRRSPIEVHLSNTAWNMILVTCAWYDLVHSTGVQWQVDAPVFRWPFHRYVVRNCSAMNVCVVERSPYRVTCVFGGTERPIQPRNGGILLLAGDEWHPSKALHVEDLMSTRHVLLRHRTRKQLSLRITVAYSRQTLTNHTDSVVHSDTLPHNLVELKSAAVFSDAYGHGPLHIGVATNNSNNNNISSSGSNNNSALPELAESAPSPSPPTSESTDERQPGCTPLHVHEVTHQCVVNDYVCPFVSVLSEWKPSYDTVTPLSSERMLTFATTPTSSLTNIRLEIPSLCVMLHGASYAGVVNGTSSTRRLNDPDNDVVKWDEGHREHAVIAEDRVQRRSVLDTVIMFASVFNLNISLQASKGDAYCGSVGMSGFAFEGFPQSYDRNVGVHFRGDIVSGTGGTEMVLPFMVKYDDRTLSVECSTPFRFHCSSVREGWESINRLLRTIEAVICRSSLHVLGLRRTHRELVNEIDNASSQDHNQEDTDSNSSLSLSHDVNVEVKPLRFVVSFRGVADRPQAVMSLAALHCDSVIVHSPQIAFRMLIDPSPVLSLRVSDRTRLKIKILLMLLSLPIPLSLQLFRNFIKNALLCFMLPHYHRPNNNSA